MVSKRDEVKVLAAFTILVFIGLALVFVVLLYANMNNGGLFSQSNKVLSITYIIDIVIVMIGAVGVAIQILRDECIYRKAMKLYERERVLKASLSELVNERLRDAELKNSKNTSSVNDPLLDKYK